MNVGVYARACMCIWVGGLGGKGGCCLAKDCLKS